MQKWLTPALLEELPFRLEDCHKRITVADRELEKCQLAFKDGFQPLGAKHWSPTSGFVDGCHDMADAGVARSEDSASPFRGKGQSPLSRLDGNSEVSEVLADPEDLMGKLAIIEKQLLGLDRTCVAGIDEKRGIQQERDELSASLLASEAKERILSSRVDGLSVQLEKAEQDAQAQEAALRCRLQDLGAELEVSLCEAQARDATAECRLQGLSEELSKNLCGAQDRETNLESQMRSMGEAQDQSLAEWQARDAAAECRLQSLGLELEKSLCEAQARETLLSSQLQRALSDLETQEGESQAREAQLRSQLERLTIGCEDALQARDAKLESHLQGHREEVERKLSEAKVREAELEARFQQLAAERAEAEAAREAHEGLLEARLKDLSLELEGARSEAQVKEADLGTQLQLLRAELAELAESRVAAQEEIECLKAKVHHLTAELESQFAFLQAPSNLRDADLPAGGLGNEGPQDYFNDLDLAVVLAEMTAPNLATVPELIFIGEVDRCEGHESEEFYLDSTCCSLSPARCQIDLVLNEILLVPLGPVGPTRKIPLASIRSFVQPQALRSAVDLELEADAFSEVTRSSGPADKMLRLATWDEQAASALIAAISSPNRVMPGSFLATSGMATPAEVRPPGEAT